MVDAVGERIDRRAQVRSQSGDADLSLLRSFVLSAAGGRGGAGSYGSRGYGTDYAMAGDGFGPGYPNAARQATRPAWPAITTPSASAGR